MWRKVWEFVKETGMLEPGDRVIVAVSGGADSVCLLRVLAENRMALRLRAVHVHHGLRGEEADRDAEFVKGFCEGLGVPLEVAYRKVREYADERGLSEEEAGRILRYEALEEAAVRWEKEERGEDRDFTEQRRIRIAVAHHQDDNAETILHHLLRGSGLRGLAGMQAVQGNRIRPLLGVRRSEILEFLREEGLEWCEDSSNGARDYTRNRIRQDLIPYMTEYVNGRAVENLLRAGELFGQADRYLEGQAERVWEQLGRVEAEGGGCPGGWQMIDREGFLGQEPLIRSYLIRYMLRMVSPGQKDITAKHIRQIERLAEGAVGGRCDLPGGLGAMRTYRELGVGYWQETSRGKTGKAGPQGPKAGNLGETASGNQQKTGPSGLERAGLLVPAKVTLPAPGQEPIRVGDWEFRVFFREKGGEIPKKEYTKWFDYDRIKATLWIRGRQQGDFLTLPGGGRKLLKRFFIDQKIPREQRDDIPMLAEGSQVLWLVGYRISEYYKIREATHTILQVDFYGGKAYGR